VLDDVDRDTPALRAAVTAGLEYAFAPQGHAAIPLKVRKACAESGLSWIVLSNDDSEITKAEATAILLERPR
jgi:hypothetical protein